MANKRSGNTIYIDSTGTLSTEKALKIASIIFTPTAADGSITLVDALTDDTKIHVAGAVANDSKHIVLEKEAALFANGIKVSVLTNAVATLILKGLDQ